MNSTSANKRNPSKNQKQQKSNKKRLKIKPFPDGFFRIELAKTKNFEGNNTNKSINKTHGIIGCNFVL
jgi:hypothetical protein